MIWTPIFSLLAILNLKDIGWISWDVFLAGYCNKHWQATTPVIFLCDSYRVGKPLYAFHLKRSCLYFIDSLAYHSTWIDVSYKFKPRQVAINEGACLQCRKGEKLYFVALNIVKTKQLPSSGEYVLTVDQVVSEYKRTFGAVCTAFHSTSDDW